MLRIKRNFEANRTQFPDNADRLLFDGVIWPAEEEIRADLIVKDGAKGRGGVVNVSNRTRTQVIALFKEFERLLSSNTVTQADFDRTLEGHLLGLEGSTLRETIQQRVDRARL